jgi:TPR repeat protein
MTNLSLEGFIPVRSFLEKIDRLQSIQLIPNDGERKIKVTKILQALSNEGFACAQVRVAFALMHESDSLCIAKDEKKGLALLQESALQQQYFACFMLGKRYWDGLSGNPKDKNEAVRFMRMATNLGRDFLEAYLT